MLSLAFQEHLAQLSSVRTCFEMLFPMASFFAKVKKFWPKTMDYMYSPWFDFWESEKVVRKVCRSKEHEK